MLPLKDDNPRTAFPVVNFVIIGINVLVYLYQLAMPEPDAQRFVFTYGAIPEQITGGMGFSTLFSSMFVHGGMMHLLGNMLYLYIFGDNVENLMGSVKYFFFYIICGLAAALSHVFVEPGSQLPMVGASGAISGVLGAYLVSFPRARVLVLFWIIWYITTVRIPAVVVLGFWFLMQLGSGLASLGVSSTGGVAWFAHIGGFVVGVVLVRLFVNQNRRARIRFD